MSLAPAACWQVARAGTNKLWKVTAHVSPKLAHLAGILREKRATLFVPSNKLNQERNATSKTTLGSDTRVAALSPPRACHAWLTTLRGVVKSLQVTSAMSQNLPGLASPAPGDSECWAQGTLALSSCESCRSLLLGHVAVFLRSLDESTAALGRDSLPIRWTDCCGLHSGGVWEGLPLREAGSRKGLEAGPCLPLWS